MEKLIIDFIYVTFAVCVVYTIAYFMGKDVNDIVGWVALGIAATPSKG